MNNLRTIALFVLSLSVHSILAQTCSPSVSISGNTAFCSGGSTALTANVACNPTPYTYLWSNGATTQSITVSNAGTYAVTVTGQVTGAGTNIIPNSNFSSGNTGFSSDYYYNTGSNAARNYTVTNNTEIWTSSYSNCNDHTPSNTDNQMFMAKGSNNTANRAWYVNVPVTPNTVYDLSAWAAAASPSLLFGLFSSYPLLQFDINGTLIGSSSQMSGACNWENMTTSWNSGSNTVATLTIRNLNTSSNFDNTFLLDDISMIPRSIPGFVIMASQTVSIVPLSTADAGSDLNNCNNNVFTMQAIAPVSGAGTWSVVSGSVVITNLNSPDAVMTLTGTTATLRWTVANGSCSSSDDVVITNSTGAAGLFCNCGPIFATSEGGTSVTFSNKIRVLNATTGLYGSKIGNTLSHVSVAVALDNRYQRLYYAPISDNGNTYNTVVPNVYFMNNSGTITNTNVRLPGTNNYNRAGFNPVDKNIYFVSSDGTNWVKYTPSVAGTGGTTLSYTTRTYAPTTAPVIGATIGGVLNGGGDIVFDALGNCYLVTNPGYFYKINFNDATTTAALTYLGQLNLSMPQVASLAFAQDGRLFAAGNGNNIFYVNLQTLAQTQVNTTTSAGSGDFASCNFPVFRPVISAYKSFRKVSGSTGTSVQTNDIIEYTINIQNTGNISAGNVRFQDLIPTGTTYVANSTLLNGAALADNSGAMPFSVTNGAYINSYDQAVQSGALSPVPPSATVKFRVRVTATSGIVSNFGSLTFDNNNTPQTTNTVRFEVCYPFASITPGANPICQGQTTVLTANEVGTYLWNTGATTQSISVNTAGTYTVTVTTPSVGGGSNIVNNSNFALGNTGFSSDYAYNVQTYGTYNITNQANTYFSFALPCPDHDSKTNNMLVADGSTTANQRVWYQTIAVVPNTTYDISAWGQGIINENPARLFFTINGTQVGNVNTLAALDCAWQQFSTAWNSGSNTSIVLGIVNQNADPNGNDFSIDDISMIPRNTQGCPKVGSIVVTVVTPTVAAAVGADLINCNNSTFNLAGNLPVSGETAYWEVVNGTTTIANANSATTTATLPVGTTATVRWVIDRNGCQSSDEQILTNGLNPTVSISGTNTVCTGGNSILTANVSATETTTIQWQQFIGSTWTNVGTNSTTYTTPNLTANTNFRTLVTNATTNCSTTTNYTVSVVADPSVSVVTTISNVCIGGGVTLTATPSGGTGTCTLQWQSSPNGTTWTDISGATNASYTPANLTNSTRYRAQISCSGSGCCN